MISEKPNQTVYGVGINDSDSPTSKGLYIDGKYKQTWKCPFYTKWNDMLRRCYSKNYQETNKAYIGCSVCDEWLTFSMFKKWMITSDWVGKQLDKDFLIEGNKIYSPETCIFVDSRINKFLTISSASRGEFPIGVFYNNKTDKYTSAISYNSKVKKLGIFSNPKEAHKKWQEAKISSAIDILNNTSDCDLRKGIHRVIEKIKFHVDNEMETTSL